MVRSRRDTGKTVHNKELQARTQPNLRTNPPRNEHGLAQRNRFYCRTTLNSRPSKQRKSPGLGLSARATWQKVPISLLVSNR